MGKNKPKHGADYYLFGQCYVCTIDKGYRTCGVEEIKLPASATQKDKDKAVEVWMNNHCRTCGFEYMENQRRKEHPYPWLRFRNIPTEKERRREE